jgi:hypothetical protein
MNSAGEERLPALPLGERIETPAALVASEPVAGGRMDWAGTIDGRGVWFLICVLKPTWP